MLWHIYTFACMINNPGDCFAQHIQHTYPTQAACKQVFDHPFDHLDEVPGKVEGSRWVIRTCIQGIKP